jgi:beta-lactamase class A
VKRLAGILVVAAVLVAAWLALRALPRRSPPQTSARTTATPVPDRLPEHPDTTLEARLGALVSRAPARCGIVAKDLTTGAIAQVNPDTLIPLLSVVKLPVAIVVLDGVDQGKWSLSTPITLLPQDMHPRGWVGDRYPRGGGHLSLNQLLIAMLTRSDNSAADALMRLVGGPHEVTRWLERHGIRDLHVDRTERALGDEWYGLAPGVDTTESAEEIRETRSQVPEAVHDSAARAMLLDPRDTGTAEACVHLLEQLWSGKLLSATMTDTLESILTRCRTGSGRLPGMLPKGTRIARKTGTGGISEGVTVAINDIGVMHLPNGHDVAIAVLVGSPRGPVHRAERLIARVARAVYDSWNAPDSTLGP